MRLRALLPVALLACQVSAGKPAPTSSASHKPASTSSANHKPASTSSASHKPAPTSSSTSNPSTSHAVTNMRLLWSGNWTQSWGTDVTTITVYSTAGSNGAAVLKAAAYNPAQPWSPAVGEVSGNRISLYFREVGLHTGELTKYGSIVWDNGSKWYKYGSIAAKEASAQHSGGLAGAERYDPTYDYPYYYFEYGEEGWYNYSSYYYTYDWTYDLTYDWTYTYEATYDVHT